MKLRSAAVVAGLALALMSGAAKAAPITFTFTGGFQSYTIGTSGLFKITAYGAEGGSIDMSTAGGKGAAIGGEFRLTQNEVIYIAVGGRGDTGFGSPGAGGGGTFISLQGLTGRASDTALVIAGGGGGAGFMDGGPGLDTPNGVGNGGTTTAGSFFDSGGAGGGFFTDGSDSLQGKAKGGSSYINGLAGGFGDAGNGGFGGGGGASNGLDAGGGGGGGFSGGNSRDLFGGGGGGSYLSSLALAETFAQSGYNAGDGYVTLEYVTSTVPLPSSAPMFGAALLALGAIGYGLKRKAASTA